MRLFLNVMSCHVETDRAGQDLTMNGSNRIRTGYAIERSEFTAVSSLLSIFGHRAF